MTDKEILPSLESDWRGNNMCTKLFDCEYISEYDYKNCQRILQLDNKFIAHEAYIKFFKWNYFICTY